MDRRYVLDYYHIERGIIENERFNKKEDMPELLDFVRTGDEFFQVIGIHGFYDSDNTTMHYIVKIEDIPEESDTIIGDLFEYVTDITQTPLDMSDPVSPRSAYKEATFVLDNNK